MNKAGNSQERREACGGGEQIRNARWRVSSRKPVQHVPEPTTPPTQSQPDTCGDLRSGGYCASGAWDVRCSSFGLPTCRSNYMLRCATSQHAVPCAPGAIMQCHARPAPRNMQCRAHPVPCATFLTFVKHSAHFLCMRALECSAPGVCLCGELVSR